MAVITRPAAAKVEPIGNVATPPFAGLDGRRWWTSPRSMKERPDAGGTTRMSGTIADSFDSRTLANMEVALERACKVLGFAGEQHEARRYIASKIIECADGGDKTLGRPDGSGTNRCTRTLRHPRLTDARISLCVIFCSRVTNRWAP